MSQKKKNIRLIILLTVLMAITGIVIIAGEESDSIDVEKDLFALEDVATIDEVIIRSEKEQNSLRFINGIWMLNDRYKADPQRVTVLFAILKQNKIRRKVANRQLQKVDSALQSQGVNIRFLSNGVETKEFKVVGFDGLTYFNNGEDSYVVEIPGYKVDLAGIFALDEGGWRNPLVFDINWANLRGVNMIFPERPNDQFNIVYQRRYYTINQLNNVDSTKVTDFLDDVSLLYVNDYLDKQELENLKVDVNQPIASIIVSDVGGNQYSLTLYNEVGDEVIGRVDSTDYALLDFEMVRNVLRPKQYFVERE